MGWLQAQALDKQALATINAYNPGLSAAWMFQRSMSVRPNHRTHPQFINRLLGVNFKSMQLRGDWVLKPFLQVNLYSICWELDTDTDVSVLHITVTSP